MIKIIDIDQLFDKYIHDYVYQNVGKIKPEEIENNIPILYEKFGNESLKELNGLTPNTFYESYKTEELIALLRTHVEQGVAVSDFLCEAISKRKADCEIIKKSLDIEENENLIAYLINFLSDMDEVYQSKYLEYVAYDYSESVSELATEQLCKCADQVKEQILSWFNDASEQIKERFCEILSYCKKDDRVFDLLTLQFVKNKNRTQLYAGYLARFGDERALTFLYQAIEQEKISYADFEELRFAIEALGGEYNKIRDFSADRGFRKIKSQKVD